ncbi:MAG: NAD(P)-dependent alcohol dehydrogenase [bacterium]
MSINCYAALGAKKPLEKFQYEPKELGPSDVEVAISHCGLCYSDVHLVDDDLGISAYPLVPGHEIIGTVTVVGSNVGSYSEGQRVGVGVQVGSCMACEACLRGEQTCCPELQGIGLGVYGGFAETIRVDSRFAYPIPEGLDSENAAPLLCGGATVFSPLHQYVKPTMRVGVIGIGGLGHLALQYANAFGCEVTAFSSTPAKEEEARTLGAHHFIVTGNSDGLEKAANSLDFILFTSHAELDWTAFLNILRPRGKLCFVGFPPGAIGIPGFPLIFGQKSVVGSLIGDCSTNIEMLRFSAQHGIKAQTELLPMTEINQAFDKLRENRVRYRMVLNN